MPLLVLSHSRWRWSSRICTIQPVGRPWDTPMVVTRPLRTQRTPAPLVPSHSPPSLSSWMVATSASASRAGNRSRCCLPCRQAAAPSLAVIHMVPVGPSYITRLPSRASCSTRSVITPWCQRTTFGSCASHTAPSRATVTMDARPRPGGRAAACICRPSQRSRLLVLQTTQNAWPAPAAKSQQPSQGSPGGQVERPRPGPGAGGRDLDGGHARRARPQPDGAVRVAVQPQRQVAGQPVAGGQRDEGAVLEAVKAAAGGPDPQPALGVLGQALDGPTTAGQGQLHRLEPLAVAVAPGEASAPGGHPQPAAALLHQRRHLRRTQPLGGAVRAPARAAAFPQPAAQAADPQPALGPGQQRMDAHGRAQGSQLQLPAPADGIPAGQAAARPSPQSPAASTARASTRRSGSPSLRGSGRSEPRGRRVTPSKLPTQMAPSAVSANARTSCLASPVQAPTDVSFSPCSRDSPQPRDPIHRAPSDASNRRSMLPSTMPGCRWRS